MSILSIVKSGVGNPSKFNLVSNLLQFQGEEGTDCLCEGGVSRPTGSLEAAKILIGKVAGGSWGGGRWGEGC